MSSAASPAAVAPALLSKIQALIAEAKQNKFHELEVKLGTLTPQGKFESGITAEQFEQLHRSLMASPSWRETKHNEYVDYSFKNSIRGSGAFFDQRIHYLTKRTHRHLDMRAASLPLGLRFSLKSEIPTELGVGRDIGTYSSVRFKQRSSFLYKGWSFDLTRVWCGANPAVALSSTSGADVLNLEMPLKRDRLPDRYEVEIEFLPAWWAANPQAGSADDQLAQSLLAKAGDLLSTAGCLSAPASWTLHKEIQFKLEEDS